MDVLTLVGAFAVIELTALLVIAVWEIRRKKPVHNGPLVIEGDRFRLAQEKRHRRD